MYGKPNSRKRSTRGVPKRKYTRKPRAPATRTNKSFTKKVKAVIHRMAENKIYTNYGANNSIVTNTGGVVPFTLGLLPVLPVGGTVANRIGNQVSIVSNIFKYRINLLPYNSITNPCIPQIVKMWVCSLKTKTQTGGTPILSDFNNFFQVGSTNLNFQGNPLDTMFNLNTEYWTPHTSRLHYLGATNNGATASAHIFDGTHSPCLAGSINLTKYCKLLKYNDAATDVTNKSLWLVIQSVRFDGTTGSSETPCEIHYTHEVKYEDL